MAATAEPAPEGTGRDPIKALLDAGALPTTPFGGTSRYAGIGVDALQPPGNGSGDRSTDGSEDDAPLVYLKRRFAPRPERFGLLYEATVVEGDRRDTLAAAHLGTPDLWWRLADANGALDPRELTERPGAMLRVTDAADLPGREAL